mmetsp:Transcript_44888/g.54364  ORF Transcript_44888/g.54364 Transcript_44888/m.54364 type:complete len:248 (+) Transcript_44888:152-895(+)|eukprot:CAMPEP_0172512974 /NCGR_PEP_ID=MMETSP1066-20121228/248503_1 /TAXON_ID=671091 /ORGANISM="Coscinodiscus wailesii, Strain CCMP2513" /LENGTH=247 /DNA_ID=CAMNT_0013293015 /DNA_START=147 /DNA_END=890 /DNA_ORIENTATION=+
MGLPNAASFVVATLTLFCHGPNAASTTTIGAFASIVRQQRRKTNVLSTNDALTSRHEMRVFIPPNARQIDRQLPALRVVNRRDSPRTQSPLRTVAATLSVLAAVATITFATPSSNAALAVTPPWDDDQQRAIIPPPETKTTTTTPTKLSDTEMFRSLRRELPVSKAVREIEDLKDLQDARLDACADRGVFWEQCFMFGESGGVDRKDERRRGLDNQLLSPVGVLEPGMASGGVKTRGNGGSNKIPTW